MLAGCDGANEPAPPATSRNGTQVYQTVNARLTEVFLADPFSFLLPAAAPTQTGPPPTATTLPVPAATPPPANPTPTGNCDLAGAGNPIDVTIPDDTKMQPGQTFTKIWRLQNAGACTWTSAYTAGHFSGGAITLQMTVSLPRQVAPGESVDLAVDMVAAANPWHFPGQLEAEASPRQGWFGIGPNAGSPFWVRIVVEPLPTVNGNPADAHTHSLRLPARRRCRPMAR